MPYISGGGGGGGAVSGVTVTGIAVSGDVPVASSGTAGTWAFPPAHEIGYTQITSAVNVVSTTEATGTAVLSPGALTFDGGAVLVEFFAHLKPPNNAVTDLITVCLFEAATQITELATLRADVTATSPITPCTALFRFTPSAAAHTYTVTAFVTNTTGTPQVIAGAGGTGANPPAFVRFVKV